VKISACVHTYSAKSIQETLDIVHSMGINTVELCSGGYAGKYHCDPKLLLSDKEAMRKFKDEFEKRNMTISALSAHGNSLHPRKDIAQLHDEELRLSIDLAAELEITNVITFSGCPGDHEDSKYPNWCLYPWPLENQEIFKFQWEKKLIPYWKKTGDYAAQKGVNIAIEMHGGFSVHTPATMLRLREETGKKAICVNVDPSHLWWQGIDPVAAIRYLGDAGAISYFHAKDTGIDPIKVNLYGLTDEQDFKNTDQRGWQFRTIGYGHDMKTWADILSTLRAVKYDGYISIEHEDAMMSADEGFKKALFNLRTVVMEEKAHIPHILSK
jgi:sugar phosphate isomerase/epimerase